MPEYFDGKQVWRGPIITKLIRSCGGSFLLEDEYVGPYPFSVPGSPGLLTPAQDIVGAINDAYLKSQIAARYSKLGVSLDPVTPNNKVKVYANHMAFDSYPLAITYTKRAVSFTVDITVSGAGGLDTGAEAVSTWYYVYGIYNPTTDDIKGLLSLSAATPTLPAGYTVRAFCGAVYNNAAGNFVPFLQNGDYCQMKEKQVCNTGLNAAAYTQIDVSAGIPMDDPERIKAVLFGSISTGADGYIFLSLDGIEAECIGCSDSSANHNIGNISELQFAAYGVHSPIAIDGKNLYYKVQGAGTHTLYNRAYWWNF